MITESTPPFSLIVPTRGRPAGLRRMLDSLRDTARNPSSIEVIAVVDEDDRESREFAYSELRLERILVPPGQTMGNLLGAGYRAARGRYLMMLNDDAEARTSGWDTQLLQVLEEHPDGIVLAHVNDLIFRDRLCTFPCLPREFCELAGGFCPPQYRRYRLDDHIHHVFDLIYLLGHARRVFLPDVVFEHHNFVWNSSGGREYTPHPSVQELDARDFEALIEERRRLALACVERIEGSASSQERAARERLLQSFPDSMAIRRREHARWWRSSDDPAASASPLAARKPGATRAPWTARAAHWGMETLAQLAARWPACARLGGIPAALFDANWYVASYPEVAASGRKPLLHYLQRGGFEGCNPNPHFDSAWYLAENPDVAASGLHPLVHFVRYGARERRSPSLLFDVRYYELQNPEIAASGMNPLEHFISSGLERGRAPCAGLTVPEYLRRIRPDPPFPQVEVNAPVPLSVVIPTRNRAGLLLRMLDACHRHGAGSELEFIVVDDGSTDETAERMREFAGGFPNLRWQSTPPGGPGRARNLAAAQARHGVLLLLGDDILPASPEFFRIHAARHAEHPEPDFAVLGRIDWPRDADFPVNFTMNRVQEDGSQFAFSRLRPDTFVSWRYFYTSNLSIKKARLGDWLAEGFDAGFPGAALEDLELGYRLWQSRQGLRLYYDPGSVGLHYHPYTLKSFAERQFFVGRSLRHLLELHPELADTFVARAVDSALRTPCREPGTKTLHRTAATIEYLKSSARMLEERGELGSEDWHGAFLTALFDLCLHDGYVAAWPPNEVNVAAAREVIVNRFSFRMRQVSGAPSFRERGTRPVLGEMSAGG